MTVDQIIRQLQEHLLIAIDEAGDIACESCLNMESSVEACHDDSIEAINQALMVLTWERKFGGVEDNDVMTTFQAHARVAKTAALPDRPDEA